MGLGGDWTDSSFENKHVEQAHLAIDAALESGITHFDHADIYTLGKAELVFGQVLKQRPELRDKICIQSKCGIRFQDDAAPGRYDFSKEWIIHSVEGILTRLGIETLDCLLLHRPDPLMEIEQVASAFDMLKQQGKVLSFGVSNMNLHQMSYLQSALNEPLVVNQVEMSLSQLDWLNDGVTGGCSGYTPTNFVAGTLEYCQQNQVQIQAWGCLSQGLFTGKDVSNHSESVQNTAKLVAKLAELHSVSKEAIVLSWLMKHPVKMQPVIGTTNVDRIKACSEAVKVNLSRIEWYQLFVTARGEALP